MSPWSSLTEKLVLFWWEIQTACAIKQKACDHVWQHCLFKFFYSAFIQDWWLVYILFEVGRLGGNLKKAGAAFTPLHWHRKIWQKQINKVEITMMKRRQILVGGNFESGGCQGKGLMSVKGILVLCSITFSQIRTNKYRAQDYSSRIG